VSVQPINRVTRRARAWGGRARCRDGQLLLHVSCTGLSV
jgi:hypothetical protein